MKIFISCLVIQAADTEFCWDSTKTVCLPEVCRGDKLEVSSRSGQAHAWEGERVIVVKGRPWRASSNIVTL